MGLSHLRTTSKSMTRLTGCTHVMAQFYSEDLHKEDRQARHEQAREDLLRLAKAVPQREERLAVPLTY